MPEVILDGPGAGMTQQEYDEMRALDCRIATVFGWEERKSGKWRSPFTHDPEIRDEPLGVPFFSLDMNGAMLVLEYAMKKWRYAARQVFFTRLQQRGSFDEQKQSCPQYPDVIASLIDELPRHICEAFMESIQWFKDNGFDPTDCPTHEAVETTEQTFTDADGNERKTVGVKLTGKPPWVHN